MIRRAPHPASGRRCRAALIVALLVAAGVPSLLPAGSAQDQPEISFSLDSLAMERAPVVAQGENKIAGLVRNDGDVPVQVWAYIEATYGENSAEGDTRTFTIPPGDSQTVQWAWDGPPLGTTADEVDFTLYGWRQVGEVKEDETWISITRAVQRNDFRLELVSGPPDTVARGETTPVAEVQVTNTGNVEDTAVLSFEFEAATEWDLVVVPSEVALPVGASHNISVVGHAPGDASSGSIFTLSVDTSEPRAGRGGNDPERAFLADLQTPGVVDGTDLVVAMTPPLLARGPGDGGTYTISVHNPTDAKVKDVHFNIPNAPDPDPSNEGISLGPVDNSPGTDLDPGESVDFTLTATVVNDALAGAPVSWQVNIWTEDEDVPRNSQDLSLTVNQTHAVNATVDGTQMPPTVSLVQYSEAEAGGLDVGLPLHEAPGSRSITWVGCGSPDCLFVDMDDDRTVSVGDIVLARAGQGDVGPGETMDSDNFGVGMDANEGVFLPAFIDQDGSGDRNQGEIIVLDDPTDQDSDPTVQNSRRGELSSGDVYLSGLPTPAGTVETQDGMGSLASLPADVFGFCYVDANGDGSFQRTEPVYFSASCTSVAPGDVRVTNALSFPHRYSAVPSETVAIPLNVTNLGNGVDTICIEHTLPDDWTAGTSCLDVDPGWAATPGPTPWNNTDSFDWDVELEPWAEAGDQMVTFSAQSEDPAVPNSTARTVHFTVAERTHPQMDPAVPPVLPSLPAEPCVFAARPGEQFTFNLALRNDGNVGGEFRLSKQDVDPGWTVSAPTNQEYALDRLGSHTAQIIVQAPEAFEPGGSSSFGFRFEDIDDPSRSHTLDCTVHASFPELGVAQTDPFTTPPDLYAGHPATLGFRVSNVGWNATGTSVLVQSVIHGPDGKELQKQNHTLPALDRWTGDWWQDLEVNFTPSKPGMYAYEVTIDPDDTLAEPDEDDNAISAEVQVFDFGIDVDAPAGREAIPTQHLTFEGKLGDNPAFKVVNDGDRTHTLNLSLAMDPPWRPVSYENVSLEPGAEHWVDVNFTIPATPLTGEVRVTLTAANATLPTLAPADTTRIRIHDTGAPTIFDFTANATAVLAGGNVSFEADLHDTTGIAEARLIVVGPGGEPASQVMTGAASVGSFSGNLTLDALGVHTVHVWAMDQAGNVADNADNASLEIRVLPDDRPHVQLIAPENGAHIRPGTPIVLSVLSRLPVDELTYTTSADAALTRVPATHPVQLPTEEWPEGEVTLTVAVEDSVGAGGDAEFAFVVDGTSPEILAVGLDPEGATPGTEVGVTATIQDASPLRSVVLRIERHGGQAQDIDLEADGADRWSADVGLPEDVVGLAVVATDEAGNRAYAERSLGDPRLHDGKSDDRFAPAPLPLLVLLAVLVSLRYRRVEDE